MEHAQVDGLEEMCWPSAPRHSLEMNNRLVGLVFAAGRPCVAEIKAYRYSLHGHHQAVIAADFLNYY